MRFNRLAVVAAVIVLLVAGAAIGWAIRGDDQPTSAMTAEPAVASTDAESGEGAGDSGQTDDSGDADGKGVTRELLATTDSADGLESLQDPRDLSMARITIPEGVTLPWHYHDGTQIAQVVSGVLTYTVREGTVDVMAGKSEEDSKVIDTIKAGETREVVPGEWLVEQPSSVHRGANLGDEPVVILSTTLLLRGAAPSIPVD